MKDEIKTESKKEDASGDLTVTSKASDNNSDATDKDISTWQRSFSLDFSDWRLISLLAYYLWLLTIVPGQ